MKLTLQEAPGGIPKLVEKLGGVLVKFVNKREREWLVWDPV
jgi:hypothetical protein